MSTCTLAEHMEETMENNPASTMRFCVPVLVQRLHVSKWEMHPTMAALTIGLHWQMPDSFSCSFESEDYHKTSGNFCLSIDDFFAVEKDPNLLPSIERIEFPADSKRKIIESIRQFINEGSK